MSINIPYNGNPFYVLSGLDPQARVSVHPGNSVPDNGTDRICQYWRATQRHPRTCTNIYISTTDYVHGSVERFYPYFCKLLLHLNTTMNTYHSTPYNYTGKTRLRVCVHRILTALLRRYEDAGVRPDRSSVLTAIPSRLCPQLYRLNDLFCEYHQVSWSPYDLLPAIIDELVRLISAYDSPAPICIDVRHFMMPQLRYSVYPGYLMLCTATHSDLTMQFFIIPGISWWKLLHL